MGESRNPSIKHQHNLPIPKCLGFKAIKDVDDESSVDEIEAVMGTTAGKYRGIYTKAFMGEAMKAAGFLDIDIKRKGKSLVVTARK